MRIFEFVVWFATYNDSDFRVCGYVHTLNFVEHIHNQIYGSLFNPGLYCVFCLGVVIWDFIC